MSGSSGYDEHGLQRALPAPVRESVALMACYTAMAPLAGAMLFTRARRAIPCRRLVVAGHRRREHGGGWGPEELPENQGAADEQRGDVDRDDDPVNAQRVAEHAVAHRLDDRV